MSEYLFAYGTLRPGHVPPEIASIVAKLRVVGEGLVYGTLYDLGTCPGLVLDPNSTTKVHGCVYELPEDPEVLRRLDEYEEFDAEAPQTSPFLRQLHAVELANGTKQECWLYVYRGTAG
jgi:gamma-glutamylcyclotransferase (GGCT)/AIG2-like uncharacterized protein YtfP